MVAANSNVNNHIFRVINFLEALLNGCVKVDVPDRAAINQHVTIQLLGEEDSRKRT